MGALSTAPQGTFTPNLRVVGPVSRFGRGWYGPCSGGTPKGLISAFPRRTDTMRAGAGPTGFVKWTTGCVAALLVMAAAPPVRGGRRSGRKRTAGDAGPRGLLSGRHRAGRLGHRWHERRRGPDRGSGAGARLPPQPRSLRPGGRLLHVVLQQDGSAALQLQRQPQQLQPQLRGAGPRQAGQRAEPRRLSRGLRRRRYREPGELVRAGRPRLPEVRAAGLRARTWCPRGPA